MTREEAIDVFKHNYPSSCFTDLFEAVEIAIQALSAQPEPRWIPVSDRLPEKSGQYYVSGGDKVWICEFLIIPNFIGGWCNDASNPVVQAWMPLPEPYKEDKDDADN